MDPIYNKLFGIHNYRKYDNLKSDDEYNDFLGQIDNDYKLVR